MENKVSWKTTHKREAVDFVRAFYKTSWDWRSQAYHSDWDKFERNTGNIYDPDIIEKKEDWQSIMFIPSTVTNVEVITSALFKMLVGKKQIAAYERREMGDELQAELNTKILDYEIEKSNFKLEFYKCLKEACTYDSGFMKFYYEKEYAPRRINKAMRYGFMEGIKAGKIPGTVKGYESKTEDVLIKDNITCKQVHIRDIFIEPNTSDLAKVLHRDRIAYGELKKNADAGYFDKDEVNKLWLIDEGDKFEEDIATVQLEEGVTDPTLAKPPAPTYAKKHTAFEYWGQIPRKWVDLNMPEDTDEQKHKANEMVEGKIIVVSGHYFMCSEENPLQFMRPPFLQVRYIDDGSSYGKGVARLMAGLQEELNEIRNLRIDNVNLLMNKIFMVVEKYLVDPNDVRSSPGAVIRLKGSDIDDVRKVIAELEVSDVPLSAFRETFELERQIQEVTGANRMTTGTQGQVKDSNQTLGGMEMLKSAAYERFATYAYLIGLSFVTRSAKMIMALSYQNRDDESLKRILGMIPIEVLPDEIVATWQAYKRTPPHELELDYDLKPVNIFDMDNLAAKRQALASDLQLTASMVPQFNPRAGLKKLYKYDGFDAAEIEDVLKGIDDVAPIPTPMGMGGGVPSLAKAVKTQTGEVAPMVSGGGA